MAARSRLSPSNLTPISTSPSISPFFKSPTSRSPGIRLLSSPSTPSSPRRCRSSFLPRSKARFLLVLILLALLTLVFTSIAYFPPLDHYDLPQPPLESIARSFEELDYALATSPFQPHLVGCPQQQQHQPTNSSRLQPRPPLLLLLGIFSTADKVDRRNFLRNQTRYEGEWPTEGKYRTDFRFILGRPKGLKSKWKVWWENRKYGDLVVVDCEENIDTGKTHAFLQWASEGRERERGWFWEVKGNRSEEEPKFVMKADDDTLLVMPNVLAALGSMDCSLNIYWGTSAGATHYFDRYFRGLGYALSWPLVKWIGSSNMFALFLISNASLFLSMIRSSSFDASKVADSLVLSLRFSRTPAHMTKIEDARTAQWLRHLDPEVDPVQYIDNGWTMVDYNQADLSLETVALHFLKWDAEFLEEQAKVRKVWSDAGKAYTPQEGVDWRKSVEVGRVQPDAARKEWERQKAAGWDV
ncbi:hypothetical protein BDY24DRAFT_438946 [Mrakia frigida]|uniref:uncharacterized protein n=1 Tax=Mrakia frigida TaxID=29902 RepID=UPI003FCC0BBF